MKIDWAALGSVFGVSLVATVALVGLFTLGVVGLSKQEQAAAQGGSATLARPAVVFVVLRTVTRRRSRVS